MGGFLMALAMALPISGAAWCVPQFVRSYGQVCLIAAVGMVLAGLFAWYGLAQSGDYAGLMHFLLAGAFSIGMLSGCATQLWVIFHREGGPPRPNEGKVRLIFAGLSVAALIVVAQGI